MTRDTNSHGWGRIDHDTVSLVTGNRTPLTVTGDTIVLDGDLSGTGIDNLLAGLGSSDAGDTSFTVNTNTLRVHWHRLPLTGSQRATVSGTGRLQVSNAVNLSPTAIPPLTTSYTPGSFTVATGTGRLQIKQLQLSITDRATLRGTARLAVI